VALYKKSFYASTISLAKGLKLTKQAEAKSSTSPSPKDDIPWPNPIYSWYVVGILMLAYTNSFIDRQILSLLVEPIRNDLDITDTQISLLAGIAFSVFTRSWVFPSPALLTNLIVETL